MLKSQKKLLSHKVTAKLTPHHWYYYLVAFILISGLSSPAFAGTFAYVTNVLDGTVSVVNTTTNAVVDTITLGGTPEEIVANSAHSTVYVTNTTNNTISVINTMSNTLSTTIPLAHAPRGLAIHPDGSSLYVANGTSISVIDTATNTILTDIIIGTVPSAIIVHPDGSKIYAGYGGVFIDTTIGVIDTTSNTVIDNLELLNPDLFIMNMEISPSGNSLYVTNGTDDINYITVFNLTTNQTTGGTLLSGIPSDIAAHPDGNTIYVSRNYAGSGSVEVFNLVPFERIASIPTGSLPKGMSTSKNGEQLYVVDAESNSVSVVDTHTNLVIDTVSVGARPLSIALTSSAGVGLALIEGVTVDLVSCENKNQLFRMALGRQLSTLNCTQLLPNVGLPMISGDTVKFSFRGNVSDTSFGAKLVGLSPPFQVQCKNHRTKISKKALINTPNWDCAQLGLRFLPNDKVSAFAQGSVP